MDVVQIVGDAVGHIHPAIEGKYYFFDSFIPITLAELLYVFFVFKWGPELMKNRAALNLKPLIITYNVFQMFINGYIAINILPTLLRVNPFCTPVGKYPHFDQRVLPIGYCYALLKIADLIETVFFVLRKKFKQVSFLHVYHHIIMAVCCWYSVRTYPSGNIGWVPAINSMVHAFMYFYYLLSNLGHHNLWWKKYVTQFQLVQHFSFVFLFTTTLLDRNCDVPKLPIFLIVINSIFFVYLFGKFYIESYIGNRTMKKS